MLENLFPKHGEVSAQNGEEFFQPEKIFYTTVECSVTTEETFGQPAEGFGMTEEPFSQPDEGFGPTEKLFRQPAEEFRLLEKPLHQRDLAEGSPTLTL